MAQFVLGTHQARAGQLLDAVRSANRALRLDPLAVGLETISVAYLNHRVGRTDEALGMWERSLAENPQALLARIGLVDVYESRGRNEEARTQVQEILRLNPDLTAELAVEIPMLRMMMDAETRATLRDRLRSAGLP